MRRKMGWKDLALEEPSGARVLVIEDNRTIRSQLVRLLNRIGYSAKGAESAEQADMFLAAESFDLALLDIELPRMNGLEFLEWVSSRDSEMAIIMVTGLDDSELALEAMRRGARTYLVKPISSEFLEAAVRDALVMRALLRSFNGSASFLHREAR
jgi:DNA-binding NtrC family response regulator